jgi:hypothetical protein
MSISRRNFLRFSALGASAMMIPSAVEAALPAGKASKKGSANDNINIGFIGLYWGSSVDGTTDASGFYFGPYNVLANDSNRRCYGLCVRAVK